MSIKVKDSLGADKVIGTTEVGGTHYPNHTLVDGLGNVVDFSGPTPIAGNYNDSVVGNGLSAFPSTGQYALSDGPYGENLVTLITPQGRRLKSFRFDLATIPFTTDPNETGLAGPLYDFGEDIWDSFSFMVEPGEEVLFLGSATTINVCVGQFHDYHDPGTTQFGYRVRTRFDKNPIQTQPTYTVFEDHYTHNLVRGQWVKVVLHAVFNYNDNAVLEVWMNGVKFVEKIGNGFNMGFNNSAGNQAAYWQYGVYRTQNSNTLAVRYSNMEQSTNSLFHRVANPLPVY